MNNLGALTTSSTTLTDPIINAITTISLTSDDPLATRKAYVRNTDGTWAFAVESLLQRSAYRFNKKGEKQYRHATRIKNGKEEKKFDRCDAYAFEINDPNKAKSFILGCESVVATVPETDIACIFEEEFEAASKILGDEISIADDKIRKQFARVFSDPAISRQDKVVVIKNLPLYNFGRIEIKPQSKQR